jgi:hypothetical protein
MPLINLFFKLSINNHKFKISKFRSLSEATPYHHNVFTFTLFLPEERAGVAWEPSNKIMLFLFLSSLVFKGLNIMVKCSVLFEVRTEFLNIIRTSFVFKGLNLNSVNQLIFVMVKCSVLFEVRTEFLNII